MTVTRLPASHESAAALCLVCEQNAAEIRGQCRRCRQGTSRDIAAGRVTEAYLVSTGLLLPSRQGRRKHNPPWRDRIERLQQSRAEFFTTESLTPSDDLGR